MVDLADVEETSIDFRESIKQTTIRLYSMIFDLGKFLFEVRRFDILASQRVKDRFFTLVRTSIGVEG